MAKLMLAKFKLCTANNTAAEKTEATRTDVHNAKTPGFKVNNTTIANGELRTVVYNTKAPGVKAKEATDKQSRDKHMCIALPPYLPKLQTPELINGGIYGNIYENSRIVTILPSTTTSATKRLWQSARSGLILDIASMLLETSRMSL
ncbi:hypothetical protein IW145_003477 [Coemansia sp. RSA 521]|nr:hypothetical protein LPJ58_001000 [Coemansia sp. RSA 1591]KAJ1766222.1 hypothetical protein LPJ69_000957 [Coemansia sp. RSA 1752]KAJ2137450.1 hypothetical protein GGH17_001557 [Coemansia sp. RSA 788]KAJ2204381.1 hypothetical protein IW145_003477 [Coemansia sp. RSA 521]KAJ2254946.1 hypothetical protein GGH98_002165 [Coemansia sp. RSA 454]KAJ2271297.1 hypothetical protein EV176_004031 [Coemansia sp. RSA 451]KAJ2284385.1 hypothetical protein GGH14_000097 [Coemansia sp. RSA 370]KAJ2293036.1 h